MQRRSTAKIRQLTAAALALLLLSSCASRSPESGVEPTASTDSTWPTRPQDTATTTQPTRAGGSVEALCDEVGPLLESLDGEDDRAVVRLTPARVGRAAEGDGFRIWGLPQDSRSGDPHLLVLSSAGLEDRSPWYDLDELERSFPAMITPAEPGFDCFEWSGRSDPSDFLFDYTLPAETCAGFDTGPIHVAAFEHTHPTTPDGTELLFAAETMVAGSMSKPDGRDLVAVFWCGPTFEERVVTAAIFTDLDQPELRLVAFFDGDDSPAPGYRPSSAWIYRGSAVVTWSTGAGSRWIDTDYIWNGDAFDLTRTATYERGELIEEIGHS